MRTSPSTHPTPARVLGAAITATILSVILAGTAAAQTATTIGPPTTLPAENPGSTAAGVVFFAVTGAIIVGALVLYLRHRPPRAPRT